MERRMYYALQRCASGISDLPLCLCSPPGFPCAQPTPHVREGCHDSVMCMCVCAGAVGVKECKNVGYIANEGKQRSVRECCVVCSLPG